MVRPEIWAAVTSLGASGFLCIGCLEKRLGRQLTSRDFTTAPINVPDPWDTPRLAAAKGRPAPPPRLRTARRFRAVPMHGSREAK